MKVLGGCLLSQHVCVSGHEGLKGSRPPSGDCRLQGDQSSGPGNVQCPAAAGAEGVVAAAPSHRGKVLISIFSFY